MQKLAAFFRIVRWQNLLFIAIAQMLFQYCILQPNLSSISQQPILHSWYFVLIMMASVFIAAAGNIINDYFDLNIDKINKPDKIVVDKYIARRWIIFWHLFFSLLGIMCSVYVAHKTNMLWIGLANCLCVLILFVYSASLKKKFLIGNIIIAALTAWVILILALPEYKILIIDANNVNAVYNKIFRLAILYASFSFIISVIREVVKDMEDIEGDRLNGCKTLPIVLGINATKTFVAVWLIVLIALLVIAQIYVVQFGWWLSIVYSILLIIVPCINITKKLFAAQQASDFATLSKLIKYVMLTGILSMLFFKIYR